ALVTRDGLVLALSRPDPEAASPAAERLDPRPRFERPHPVARDLVRMSLVGSRESVAVQGLDPLPGRVNYFIGKDPTKWRTDIPTWSRVAARGVWDGIDVVYYGNPRQLEYDFVVAPGADPGVIRLAFDGAERMWTDERGDLVLALEHGELRLRKPVVYQTIGGARRVIESAYRVTTRGERAEGRIALAAWDRSRPLVIDPVLVYATFLTGSGFWNRPGAVAVDTAGNAYIAGETISADFPATPGSFQSTFVGVGFTDVFVAKLNATGTALLYSTFLGGT